MLSKDSYYERNKEKIKARSKAWKAANPNKVKGYESKRYRKNVSTKEGRSKHNAKASSYQRKKIGVSPEEYNRLKSLQGNCCAICGKTEEQANRSLAVDHDHETGAVRGLLCYKCNLGIGNLNDDPKLLARGISYLTSDASQR